MVDLKKLLADNGLGLYPAGLGGCRVAGINFDSCGHDIFVFDGKSGHEVVWHGKSYVVIRHASMYAHSSGDLLACDGIRIIQDESWDLKMHTSAVQAKRSVLFVDLARDRLIEALFCTRRALNAIDASDVFAPFWQKCASYCLADAICLLNYRLPSPSHMLDLFRTFPKNSVNEHISSVTQTIGMERATPTLLDRMLKSTIGFSDIIRPSDSKIIRSKYEFFLRNSMPTDCYFYLGYVNRQNFEEIKDDLSRRRDLFHILKTAFDAGADPGSLDVQANLVEASCNSILEAVSGA